MKALFFILIAIIIINCNDNKKNCFKIYYSENLIKAVYCYDKDTINLEKTDYEENGQIISKVIYKKPKGKMQLFYHGILDAEGECDLNWDPITKVPICMPNGKWAWFNDNGKVIGKGFKKNGKNEGWLEQYTEDGKLIKRILYEQGEFVKEENL